ncbi:NrfD/PsrC family molybdoenzyme membrane anchor subunit [Thermoproteus tenax]|uniref:Sulfur/polysulfide reductase, membrane subunit n=1 Tax=Thermoproteus tenax (strain ATCC 35583 / DSM 2078 / JCM 9277 / NBRC 100435 / Kra 1) TaxID=768679 RepID=G4RMB9_THETK|nr:NrfD/PsrC family molybdoenzyme membrane anchor subunit [Thermoproteus tenax]CCC80750.1 sulfur/polysulfide reductase, membrane subunit [Thermoproteus tenax Kra 1]
MRRPYPALISIGIAALGALLISIGYMARSVEEIPWGLLVPGYVYFALMATGSSIVNSIYTVFGYKGPDNELERIIKLGIWFSLITIVPAWIMILLDLRNPLSALNIFIHYNNGGITLFFQYKSGITWMATLYMLFALTLMIELIYFIRSGVSEKLRRMKALEFGIALAVLIVTVVLHSNLGQVFGNVVAIPGWYGPHMALYFIASAIAIGASGQALFIGYYAGGLGIREFVARYYARILMITIPVLAFIKGWMIINAWYNPASWQAYRLIINSPDFYIFELALLLIAPFILATMAYYKKDLKLTLSAALLVAVAGFVDKYDLIIKPQEAPLALSLGAWAQLGSIHYIPSISQIEIAAGSVLLYLALLILGTLILPLKPGEKPKALYIFK